MNPGVSTLYHDIKARQAAREMASKPKGMRAVVAAWIRRSWHHTFTDPRFTRIVNR